MACPGGVRRRSGRDRIGRVKAGAGFKGVKLYATVLNVFDRYYAEHLSYQRDPFATGVKVPETGRSCQLAAQYAY